MTLLADIIASFTSLHFLSSRAKFCFPTSQRKKRGKNNMRISPDDKLPCDICNESRENHTLRPCIPLPLGIPQPLQRSLGAQGSSEI
ncbi:MAG: hypothetical protein ACFFCS_08860 [Candidatus Hodarchaeota archaeon]